MQTKFVKILALILAFSMMVSFTGCDAIESFFTLDHDTSSTEKSKHKDDDDEDEEDEEEDTEETATETSEEKVRTTETSSSLLNFPDHSWTYDEIHPEHENGTVQGSEATEILDRIENEMISESLTSSYLAYCLYFDDPSVFGVDSCEPSWGEVVATEEEREESITEVQDYLDELYTIDADSLSTDDKLFYDKIVYDLEESAYGLQFDGFDYVEGVFNPLTGPQCEILFVLTTFTFDDVEDAENYIAFIEDTDRYYDEICDFEEDRAACGFANSAESYESIAESFDNLAEQADDCFLYEDFENRLDNISGLSDEERESLIEEHNEAMHDVFFPEFEECAERMRALKTCGGEDTGVCNYEGGTAYYEYHFRNQCNTSMTVEEAADEIDSDISQIMSSVGSLAVAFNASQDMMSEYLNHDYSMGSAEENLDYLEAVISEEFPDLVDHSYVILDVPESLQENFSPAAYLASHLDNFNYNLILISDASESDVFGTICAHEGYPGHMFQSVYTRSHTEHPYMYLADSIGYNEGWAQYVECYSYKYFASDETVGSILAMERELNLLLMARMDIGIHYEGWDLDDCADYASEMLGYDLGTDSLEEIYDVLVLDPCYATKYAIGFIKTTEILSNALSAYPDATIKDIHTAYLDALTGTFEQIEAYVDEELQAEFG